MNRNIYIVPATTTLVASGCWTAAAIVNHGTFNALLAEITARCGEPQTLQ